MTTTAQEMVNTAKKNINEISAYDAQHKVNDGYTVLDVREANEFEEGHLPNAILIPRGLLEFSISSHPVFQDKGIDIMVYCKSGGRAALAADTLQKMGYSSVISIAGGYDAWKQV